MIIGLLARVAIKGKIRVARNNSLQVKSGLPRMVVSPHARFPARNAASRGNKVPPVWTVIYRVQQ